MFRSAVLISFALVALFACVQSQDTTPKPPIKCYNCPSGCPDYGTEQEKTCEADQLFCYILWKDEQYTRGCAKTHDEICTEGGKAKDYCSTCSDEDLCNSASTMTSTLFIFSIGAFLLKAIY